MLTMIILNTWWSRNTQVSGPEPNVTFGGADPTLYRKSDTNLFLLLASVVTHGLLVLTAGNDDVMWCKRSWYMGTKPLEVEGNYNLLLGLGCHFVIDQWPENKLQPQVAIVSWNKLFHRQEESQSKVEPNFPWGTPKMSRIAYLGDGLF